MWVSTYFPDSTKTNNNNQRQQPNVSNAALMSIENNQTAPRKRKRHAKDGQDERDALMRNQNEQFHELRKQIQTNIGTKSQKWILEHNQQYVPYRDIAGIPIEELHCIDQRKLIPVH